MEMMTPLILEQAIRQFAEQAVMIIGLASLASMLSWCLAAGIMPRGHAENLASRAENGKGAQRR